MKTKDNTLDAPASGATGETDYFNVQWNQTGDTTVGTAVNTIGGYTCATCGYWVAQGTLHTCQYTYPSYPATAPTYPGYVPQPQIIYTQSPVDFSPLVDAVKELSEKIQELIDIVAAE